MDALYFIIFIIAIVAFVARVIHVAQQKSNRTKELKAEYEAALNSGDKKAALEAGRAYYSFQREDGKLTIFDEQAITNDLSVM